MRQKRPRSRSGLWPLAIVGGGRPSDNARLSWYQSRAYRRLASAATPASISSSVFGGPATLSDPNTWSGRVRLKIGAALNTTPSGVSSTIRRVPTSQCRRCRIDLGRITCPLVESVVVSLFVDAIRFHARRESKTKVSLERLGGKRQVYRPLRQVDYTAVAHTVPKYSKPRSVRWPSAIGPEAPYRIRVGFESHGARAIPTHEQHELMRRRGRRVQNR